MHSGPLGIAGQGDPWPGTGILQGEGRDAERTEEEKGVLGERIRGPTHLSTQGGEWAGNNRMGWGR